MPDWKQLKPGQKIRVVAIPASDLEAAKHSRYPDTTVAVLQRLIDTRAVVTISRVDEYGLPWFEYEFVNTKGVTEFHALTIFDNDSWVFASAGE